MKSAARIRVGAIVFSDHSFPHWGEHIGVGQENRLFKYDPLDTNHNRYNLRAHGFGLPGEAYGNGSLFVSKDDITIFEVTDEEYASVLRPAFPVVKPVKREPGYWLVVGDGYSDIVKVNQYNEIERHGVLHFSFEKDYRGNPHWYGPIDLHELMLFETAKSLMSIDLEKARDIYKELSNGLIG